MTNLETIRTTKEILSIHNANSGVIMRGITSKYRELIEEVKFYINSGWDKLHAISFTLFDEYDYKFTSDNENERTLLKEWLIKNQ